MKKALIGAGNFSREIKAHMKQDLICFVDNEYYEKIKEKNIMPLSSFDPKEYEVLIALNNPLERFKMAQKLPKETKYFSFVHKSSSILGDDVIIGKGSIICANSVLTTNIILGNHSHINLNTTIGHDCRIGDCFTTAPGANISGNCNIGNRVYIGTNSSVKQKINICDDVTIGLNSGVVKDIDKSGIYIGTPSKKIKDI